MSLQLRNYFVNITKDLWGLVVDRELFTSLEYSSILKVFFELMGTVTV